MPQMAPSLWMPMLITMMFILIYLKSMLHFTPVQISLLSASELAQIKKHSWLW